jgi:hypothetical protein
MNLMNVTKLINPECLTALAGVVLCPVIIADEVGGLFITLASGAVVPINDLLGTGPERK